MQRGLFDFETDKPITQQVRESNFDNIKEELPSTRERVLNAIMERPTSCKALAIRWNCNPNDISGRFTELKQDHRIIESDVEYLPNHKGQMRAHTVWSAIP